MAAAAGGASIAAAEDAAEAGLPLARRPPDRFLPGAAAALVFAFPPGRRVQPGGEDPGKWLPRKGRGVCACAGKGGVRLRAPADGPLPLAAWVSGRSPLDLGPAERGRWRRRLVFVLLPRLRPVALARPAKGQWQLWRGSATSWGLPLPLGGGGQVAAQQGQRAGGVT